MKIELNEREMEALCGLIEGKAAEMEREARDGWGEVYRERASFWRGILRKMMRGRPASRTCGNGGG